jgi:hypothetical protein
VRGMIAGMSLRLAFVLVAVVSLSAACAGVDRGGVPTPRPQPTYAPKAGELCAESVPPGSEAAARPFPDLTFAPPTFALCIVQASGKVSGSVQAVSKLDEGACRMIAYTTVTLSGTYAAPRLSGIGAATTTFTLSGLCGPVRERYVASISARVEWSGAVSGTQVGLTVPTGVEGAGVVRLEGRVR